MITRKIYKNAELSEIQAKKTALLSDVTNLGKTLDEMNLALQNHEARKIESESLDKEIDFKKQQLASAVDDINKIGLMHQESESLKLQLASLKNDIASKTLEKSKLEQMIGGLKDDVAYFTNEKNKAQSEHEQALKVIQSSINEANTAKDAAVRLLINSANAIK